jgi:hypothetical protein
MIVGIMTDAARAYPSADGMELVGAEHRVPDPPRTRAQQIAERDREGRRPRPPRRSAPRRSWRLHVTGEPAQRRLDRLDRADVRAGADDDLAADRRATANGLAEMSHRLAAAPWRE